MAQPLKALRGCDMGKTVKTDTTQKLMPLATYYTKRFLTEQQIEAKENWLWNRGYRNILIRTVSGETEITAKA